MSLVSRILPCSRRLYASNLFLSLILHLGNLFLIVQLHFSKLFLVIKSCVNHTSRGSISGSALPSIKRRKCSSKLPPRRRLPHRTGAARLGARGVARSDANGRRRRAQAQM